MNQIPLLSREAGYYFLLRTNASSGVWNQVNPFITNYVSSVTEVLLNCKAVCQRDTPGREQ
jgi:hypothetical protein